jgi:hypothetical protein
MVMIGMVICDVETVGVNAGTQLFTAIAGVLVNAVVKVVADVEVL